MRGRGGLVPETSVASEDWGREAID